MQMGLSGKSVVDFVVFTDVDLVYFPIQFDVIQISHSNLNYNNGMKLILNLC